MREARNIDATFEEERVAMSHARELHWDMAPKPSRACSDEPLGTERSRVLPEEESYVSIAK